MRISISTVFSILFPITFGKELYLCQNQQNVPFPIGEDVPIVDPWWQWPSNMPLICNLTLTNIPAGSWVGVFKDTFNLHIGRNTDASCSHKNNYLRIAHPVRGAEDFCGYVPRSVIYTAYSEEEAYLRLMLHAKEGYYPYPTNNFSLLVKVARVVYSGKDKIRREQGKYSGSVVSHSLYLNERYDPNITSTLILSGLKFSTQVYIRFYKVDFDDDCTDYLEIVGIRKNAESANHLKICSTNVSSQYDGVYTTTDSDLTIRFVSRSKQLGYGFRLSYQVQSDTGCDHLEIPHSNATFDSTDDRTRTYFLQCDEGYSFNGTDQSTERVICINKEWFRLSNCTDDCRWNRRECYRRCNKGIELESLQCILIEETTPKTAGGGDVISTAPTGEETSMSTSMITYIGIGVGTFLLLIIVVVIVSVLLYRRRKRQQNDNINIHYSAPTESCSAPSDAYESLRGDINEAPYEVCALTDDVTSEPFHQYDNLSVPTSHEHQSEADRLLNKNSNVYYSIPKDRHSSPSEAYESLRESIIDAPSAGHIVTDDLTVGPFHQYNNIYVPTSHEHQSVADGDDFMYDYVSTIEPSRPESHT